MLNASTRALSRCLFFIAFAFINWTFDAPAFYWVSGVCAALAFYEFHKWRRARRIARQLIHKHQMLSASWSKPREGDRHL